MRNILILAAVFAAIASNAATAQTTMCPLDYTPVCGVMESGRRQDFTNACFAHVAGAKVIVPGKCDASPRSEGLPLPWPFPWAHPETDSGEH